MAQDTVITNFQDIKLPEITGGKKENPFGGKEAEDRTPTKYWLNVGVLKENSEGKPVLISLPVGIGCDSLKPKRVPGPETNNPEFRAQRIAEVGLLKLLKDKMATLKPGERAVLRGLTVELYHVKENESLDDLPTEGNPFLVAEL